MRVSGGSGPGESTPVSGVGGALPGRIRLDGVIANPAAATTRPRSPNFPAATNLLQGSGDRCSRYPKFLGDFRRVHRTATDNLVDLGIPFGGDSRPPLTDGLGTTQLRLRLRRSLPWFGRPHLHAGANRRGFDSNSANSGNRSLERHPPRGRPPPMALRGPHASLSRKQRISGNVIQCRHTFSLSTLPTAGAATVFPPLQGVLPRLKALGQVHGDTAVTAHGYWIWACWPQDRRRKGHLSLIESGSS